MKDLSVELILWARRLDQEFKEKIEKERGREPIGGTFWAVKLFFGISLEPLDGEILGILQGGKKSDSMEF